MIASGVLVDSRRATELAHRDGSGTRLSERAPWTVSFSFGLLHGFGFAGALREIGLPQADVPLALLSFNLGVELGQIAFIALVLVAGWLAARFVPKPQSIAALRTLCIYGVGAVSVSWLIERTIAVVA